MRGHLIAVTGASAERLLATPTVTTALSPATLRRGVEAGQFESRAPAKRDWTRIVGYGALPQSRLTLSKEEIARINKDFDRLHFGKDRGVAPDGTDLPRERFARRGAACEVMLVCRLARLSLRAAGC